MSNRLKSEQSPYLLQHANNPVDWYPWGEEAFEKAKKEDRPVLVSIGYSACHWCHVMERESFENTEVATFMNSRFVCVKVDREEYPDVDHMYMDAVQAICGSGGWPLNVFVTPEKIPFYGGTYFPPMPAYNRPSWMQILEWIDNTWKERKDEINRQVEQMFQYLLQISNPGFNNSEIYLDKAFCRKVTEGMLKQADTVYGGFGTAPKFPSTMCITFLLEHYYFTGFKPALEHGLLSLDAMIKGGIHDQIGGGFARYATDNKWLVPHFEKMLYDNALIIFTLCDAYAITKEPHYKTAINDTLTFIERELKEPSGAYYSALDADSEGVEGKFYTWNWDDWDKAAGADSIVLSEYWGVSKEGNWEGANILHVEVNKKDLSVRHSITAEELDLLINDARQSLLKERSKRVRPGTDDKSLLSWNALMNIALSKAGSTLGEDVYLSRAEEHMQWMVWRFEKENCLKHTWKNGDARIAANLDDYAFLIQAMLQLASAKADNKWILKAWEMTKAVEKHFLCEDEILFYYSSEDEKNIPVRKVEIYDGATPSANAVMASNLLVLGMCLEQSKYVDQAFQMLQKLYEMTLKHATSFGCWATLIQRHVAGVKIVVCTGPFAREKVKELQQHFTPHCIIITSEKEISDIAAFKNKFSGDKVSIFVCDSTACLATENETDSVLRLISPIW